MFIPIGEFMPFFKRLVEDYAAVCTENELSTAAAALSYYLTLTFFPLVICLYVLLGSNYERIIYMLGFLRRIMPTEAANMLEDFLWHVSENNSPPMLAAGLAVLISSSSAAVRSMQAIIGRMQGGQRFHGIKDLLYSLVFSVFFILAIYFAAIIMLMGENFFSAISRVLPLIDGVSSWRFLRFPLLAGIELVIVHGAYAVSKRSEDSYSTIPGAAFAAFGMAAVSLVFSLFISVSRKYPLVYGSLAAMILLMFWLYLCCFVIYLGAALNISLRNIKNKPGHRS